MDFLAHFSTVEKDYNGSFSMLVSAPDAEKAVEKFRKKILDANTREKMFAGVEKIFLEVIIKINRIPNRAAITYFESRSDDGLGSISVSPVNGKSLEAFGWYPDDKPEQDFDKEHVVSPFIEFA